MLRHRLRCGLAAGSSCVARLFRRPYASAGELTKLVRVDTSHRQSHSALVTTASNWKRRGRSQTSVSLAPFAAPAQVSYWHFGDIARSQIDFRFRWKSGRAADITAISEFDPNVWSGRAVQEASSTWLMRSCINVSGLCLERVVLRAIMDISAHAVSLPDRPRPGHLGHQCSHAPGRPISIIVSSSRRPRRAN